MKLKKFDYLIIQMNLSFFISKKIEESGNNILK